ncbi:hypothetical protein ACFC5X_29175 [Streptomyces sp. NPDC055952]|uniref:hypothetical protein n=1 Tax=Streptomyces sp. NPDC055952 TaxID=3345663 RepID=UPI0035DC346A
MRDIEWRLLTRLNRAGLEHRLFTSPADEPGAVALTAMRHPAAAVTAASIPNPDEGAPCDQGSLTHAPHGKGPCHHESVAGTGLSATRLRRSPSDQLAITVMLSSHFVAWCRSPCRGRRGRILRNVALARGESRAVLIANISPRSMGKTTDTSMMGHAFHEAGYRVQLWDADESEHLTQWSELAGFPFPVKHNASAKFAEEYTPLGEAGIDIVDVGHTENHPHIADSVLKVADLVLIHMEPSMADYQRVHQPRTSTPVKMMVGRSTVRGKFARRHVLAEARRHLLETLRGQDFTRGLDDYIAYRALSDHSRQSTVPQPGRRAPAAGRRPDLLHRRLHRA